MSENVIYLKYRSPDVEDGTLGFVSCSVCKNKSYSLVEDKPNFYPLLRCTACGQHIGRMGWIHDLIEPVQQEPRVPMAKTSDFDLSVEEAALPTQALRDARCAFDEAMEKAVGAALESGLTERQVRFLIQALATGLGSREETP